MVQYSNQFVPFPSISPLIEVHLSDTVTQVQCTHNLVGKNLKLNGILNWLSYYAYK